MAQGSVAVEPVASVDTPFMIKVHPTTWTNLVIFFDFDPSALCNGSLDLSAGNQ